MEDRIRTLKGFLPPFLVANWKIYSILSKGIHELSEVECKLCFPTVRKGIEQILTARIAVLEAEAAAKDGKKELDALQESLKESGRIEGLRSPSASRIPGPLRF